MRDTSSHGNRRSFLYQIKQHRIGHGRHIKPPPKIDFEVISQCCIGIINVHDTLYYDNRHLYRISFAGRTRRHVKDHIKFSLSSKIYVVSGSSMYTTHRFMMILLSAKYDMSMSNQKVKLTGRKRFCTDRWVDWKIDRQTDKHSDS